MSSQDNDQDSRVVAVVLISTILLAVGLALGMGIYKARGGSAPDQSAMPADAVPTNVDATAANTGAEAGSAMETAVVEATDAAERVLAEVTATTQAAAGAVGSAASEVVAAVTPAQADSGDEPSIVMENGVVKFYFASGKSDLAPGAMAALGGAIAAAKNGKRLLLSGFHDSTGSATSNADLAKKRAMAVREALLAAGVDDSAMVLKEPEMSTGSGSAAEARRVEVTIEE